MATDTIGFGIKVTANTSEFASGVDASKAKLREFADEAKNAGESVDTVTQRVAAQNRQMSATTAGLAASTSKSKEAAAATRGLDDDLVSLIASLDKTYRNSILLERGNDLLTRGLQAGLISTAQYEKQLAALAVRYGAATTEGGKHSGVLNNIGLSAGFAGRELHAMVDELSSGRTAQFQGTVANILGRIGQVNPVAVLATVAIGALAGSFIYAAAKAEGLDRSIAQAQAGLAAMGHAGQQTDAQLKADIQSLEGLSGISRASAEKIIAELSRVPKVGQALFQQLVSSVADFAAATGVAAPAAAEKLAKAFENPFQGAKTLDAELNILTGDQVLQIEQFKRTGDIVGAQQVLYAALQARIQGLHDQALTPLQKQEEELAKTWLKTSHQIGDSEAIRGARTAYMGFLGVVESLIEKLPSFADLLKRAAASAIPGGLVGSAILATLAAAGPKASAGGAGKNSVAPPPESLEATTKALLELTSGYKSASERQKEMGDTATTLRIALIKMEDAGQSNSATYKRLKDALVALEEQMKGPLQARIEALKRAAQLEEASEQASFTVFKAGQDRRSALLDAKYSNSLISEKSYIEQKAAIETADAQRQIDTLTQQIEREKQLRAQVAATNPIKLGGQDQKDAQLSEIDQKLLDLTTKRTVATEKLGQIGEVAGQKIYAVDAKQFELEAKTATQLADFYHQQQQSIEQQQQELALAGQNEIVVAKANAERAVRVTYETEINKLLRERADLEKVGPIKPEDAERINNAIANLRANMGPAAAAAGQFAASIATAAQNANALTQAFQAVDDFMFQTFSRFRDGWRAAAQYAGQQIKTFITRAIYEATIQRGLIQIAIAAGVPGSSFSNASPIANALFGVPGATGASSGGLLGSITGLGGGGIPAAGGFGGAATAGIDSFLINNGAADLAGGALTSTLGFIASALPYLGVALAIYSLFAKKGGGPKSGGSYNALFDASGGVIGNPAVTGTDNGRFFTPNQDDSSLRDTVTQLGHSFEATAAALGAKNVTGFTFGLGEDSDPNGTANNRVSASVSHNGKLIYDVRDESTGRDSQATADQLSLEAKRSFLAALQDSDLPPTIAKIINSLDVRTASSQAIDDAITLATTFQSILAESNRSVTEDASTVFKQQSQTALENLRDQGAALVDLANKFDGSAAKAQELATAQTAYRNSLIQLLASIREAQAQIHSMFQDTEESIRRAGLTDQQLYNYLQTDADTKYQQLLASHDPATIQRLAGQINDDISQAFGLLSPQQQGAERSEFLSHLNTIDTTINQHMTDVANEIATQGVEPMRAVADKLDAVADRLLTAADNLNTAATNLNRGGNGVPPPATTVVITNPIARDHNRGIA